MAMAAANAQVAMLLRTIAAASPLIIIIIIIIIIISRNMAAAGSRGAGGELGTGWQARPRKALAPSEWPGRVISPK
jgi:hypothetical protein